MSSYIYNDEFYSRLHDDSLAESSKIIFELLLTYITVESVIDVGCGTGVYLKYFYDKGIEVKGVDGAWVPDEYLAIPKDKFFIAADLNKKFTINQKFDLAISIELAEHLKPQRAESFVKDLTRLSDIVLFSAAIPMQGGRAHINEKFPEYWADKFYRLGYFPIDLIRPHIWMDERVKQFWLKQNLILYVKKDKIKLFPERYRSFKHYLTKIYDMESWINQYKNLLNDKWYRFGRINTLQRLLFLKKLITNKILSGRKK
jgi:SAM-dependent methyltransferase